MAKEEIAQRDIESGPKWFAECKEALEKSPVTNISCTGSCKTCPIHKGLDALGKLKDTLYMHENYGV